MAKDVLTQRLLARGNKGAQESVVLFDSGASQSFVRRGLAAEIATISALPHPLVFTLADGRQLHVNETAVVSFDIGGTRITDMFLVHPEESADAVVDDLLLGASTMRKFGLKLDFEHSAILCTLVDNAPAPANGAVKKRKEFLDMNELLQRILARLGYEKIPESLTDEDALNMIVERCNRPYYSVLLKKLNLSEKATEPEIEAAIEGLKKATTFVEPDAKPFLKKLMPALGLSVDESCTEEQAQEQIVKAVKKPAPATAVASKGVLAVLELDATATEEDVVGAILAAKFPGNVVTVAQHKDLEEQHRAYRLTSLVTESLQKGKLYPAEKTWALDRVKEWDGMGLDGLATLEKFLDKRPKLMPIGERLQVAPKEENGLDGDTLTIAKQMGVSTDTLKKYAA